jgi:wobble nucleotide-excising tRNase
MSIVNLIQIKNVATYENESISLKKVNFFYGQNGSGKTTISRVFLKSSDFPECCINSTIDDYEVLVYNRDFVENNFKESQLKGIFTLGENAGNVQTKIEKAEIKKTNIFKSNKTKEEITIVNRLINNNEDIFLNKCWSLKTKYESTILSKYLKNLGTRINFKNKILEKFNIFESENLKTLESLEKSLNELYIIEPIKKDLIDINSIEFDLLIAIENDELPNEVIIGKEDSPLSELILKLENNDWVDKGRNYLIDNIEDCPFCQQSLPKGFKELLEGYFDEVYKEKKTKLEDLFNKYNSISINVLEYLKLILKDEELSKETNLGEELNILDKQLNSNVQILNDKLKMPSNKVLLHNSTSLIISIKTELEKINLKINEHNTKIDNITDERKTFEKNVWNYIINELIIDIEQYNLNIITNNNLKLKNKRFAEKYQIALNKLETKISEYRNETVNIEKSIINVNNILRNNGFDNFEIKKYDELHYKIVRNVEENNVFISLSEGEKTFVTFLYFLEICKGTLDKDNNCDYAKRVVVIDDPISSLDNNILFAVATLIKSYFFNGKDLVNCAQFLLLTHNIFFYQEMKMFIHNKKDGDKSNIKFFKVSKKNNITKVTNVSSANIQNDYESSWEIIKNIENYSPILIPNTMRKIFEEYFNFTQGYEKFNQAFDALIEEHDSIQCKSFARYLDRNSHKDYHNIFYDINEIDTEQYALFFKMIFEKTNNIEHYNKMMNKEE